MSESQFIVLWMKLVKLRRLVAVTSRKDEFLMLYWADVEKMLLEYAEEMK